MTAVRALSAVAVVAAFGSLRAEVVWAPVPADPRRPGLGGVAIPPAAGPDNVRLVGLHPLKPLPAKPGVWHLTESDWLAAAQTGPAGSPVDHPREPETPGGAIRLESSDRIYTEVSGQISGHPDAELRNPWALRSVGRPRTVPVTLECKGVAVGGSGGAVAWINGRAVRRGDRLGPFRVEAVRRDEVMLELHGGHYVLPRGRKATVAVIAP